MKISIITPSFNQGQFIEANIKSVKNQNYQNLEHIIYDNVSQDNTKKILKKYKHLKLSIKKDKGQSHALNKMLEVVTGDIIGWQNADDFYSNNIFHNIVKIFNNNPNIDVIYGNFNIVDHNENVLKTVNSLKFYPSLAPFLCFIPSTTFFCRTAFIRKNKLFFNEKFNFMMDKEFYCRVINKTKKIYKLDKVISNFRYHKKSKTAFKINKISKKNFYYEGIQIINSFTFLTIKKNFIGIIIYKFLINFFTLISFLIKKID